MECKYCKKEYNEKKDDPDMYQLTRKNKHPDLKIKTCPHCRVITDYAPEKLKVREEEQRIKMEKNYPELLLNYNWGKKNGFSIFCIISSFFMLTFGFVSTYLFLYVPEFQKGINMNFLYFFMPVYIIMFAALSYILLTGMVNRTVIKINKVNTEFYINHTPFPWPGNKDINTTDIQDIFCREHLEYSDKIHLQYSINIVQKNGTTLKILSGIPDLNEALIITMEIEKYLELN